MINLRAVILYLTTLTTSEHRRDNCLQACISVAKISTPGPHPCYIARPFYITGLIIFCVIRTRGGFEENGREEEQEKEIEKRKGRSMGENT